MASQFWKDNCGTRLGMFINMDEFSDVTLRFGDRKTFCSMNCHYVVLALHSNVFRDTLPTCPIVEGGRRCVNFTDRPEREQTAISDIIISFYNGILTIDEDNFAVVYNFAEEYKVEWILAQARLELHKFVAPHNLISLFLVSERTRCKSLRKELTDYIKSMKSFNISSFLSRDTLLTLTPELLFTVLKASKDVEQRKEDDVLEYVLAWMGGSPVKLAYTKKLFSAVAWERLSQTEVEVERLGERLSEEIMGSLDEVNRPYVVSVLQDSLNYAACRTTMTTAHTVFMTSRWAACPFEIAEFVLGHDHLTVANEYVVAEAALVWIDAHAASVTPNEVTAMLSTIRLDTLHSSYLLRVLQPHVSQYGITPREWLRICAEAHPPRRSLDTTVSGSVVALSLHPKKSAKDFCSLKDGQYTFTAVCTCAYFLEVGARECLSVTLEVNVRSVPPVTVRSSQCRHCNRVVLHVLAEKPRLSDAFASLNCGNINTIRNTLKTSGVRLSVVLSEAENRINLIRSRSWCRTEVRTVVRTLSNDNLKSLTEYEVLEAALTWLDHRLPDKTYFEAVMSCVRYQLLHEVYLKEAVTQHIRTSYTVEPNTWKVITRKCHGSRRWSTSTQYQRIVTVAMPRAVLLLVEGDHVINTECLCEPSVSRGTIRTGRLHVTFNVAVKRVPVLRVTGGCDKCNITVTHVYLTVTPPLAFFPTLVNTTVYRIREVFEACLGYDEDVSSGSSDSEASHSLRQSIKRSFSSKSLSLSTDVLGVNLILSP